MTSLTNFLKLKTYHSTKDSASLVSNYINDVSGSDVSNNLAMIDTFASQASASVTSLIAQQTGWINPAQTWTFASASKIFVPSGASAIYSVGDKLKFDQSSATWYYYVTAVSNSSLQVAGSTVANAAISNNYYSKAETPLGFPQYFIYTPIWSGSSTDPALGTTGSFSGKFTLKGRTASVEARLVTGADTTFGIGTWAISLPIKTATSYSGGTFGTTYIRDTNVSLIWMLYASTTTGASKVNAFFTGSAVAPSLTVHSAYPMTWASGDSLFMKIDYEI